MLVDEALFQINLNKTEHQVPLSDDESDEEMHHAQAKSLNNLISDKNTKVKNKQEEKKI